MSPNPGATVALLFATLLIARYLVFHNRALGLAHGPAHVIAGLVFAVALVAARLLARRR